MSTEWEIPVWATAQVCIVLYIIGVGIPYTMHYMSHKNYKHFVRDAIARYNAQKREAERRRRIQAEKKKGDRACYSILGKQARAATRKKINQAESSSSSSSSSCSDTEIEEEEEEMHEVPRNDRTTLMQYVHGNDLFDGQSCTTSASAASTIILAEEMNKKKLLQQPRKKGSVIRV